MPLQMVDGYIMEHCYFGFIDSLCLYNTTTQSIAGLPHMRFFRLAILANYILYVKC